MALRVVIVEDSLTVRRRLCDAVASDPELVLIAEVSDGARAIEVCRALRPDVIAMDMMLPVMTGLEATEYIMAHFPTPILIVSSSTNRGDLFKTYDALAAGAIDVLEKPQGNEAEGVWEAKLVSAVKLISRIRVITHPRARLRSLAPPPIVSQPDPAVVRSKRSCRVVALGASTGGPGALVQVLRSIPTGSPVALLVVLHIDKLFGSAFAEWLDAQTRHRVAYVRGGEDITALTGQVTMAPPGLHLVVRAGKAQLTTDPERHFCRPSIDVLFESLASDCGADTVACLLTGMGRDGAAGLLAIRRAGGYTIAQDEATSVVYGMPREAALLGAAERVLPLEAIGSTIAAVVGAPGRGRTAR